MRVLLFTIRVSLDVLLLLSPVQSGGGKAVRTVQAGRPGRAGRGE